MVDFYKPTSPQPENVQLGEGVLVFNFDPTALDGTDEVPFGAVRGGGTYNIERTDKPIRYDGDHGEDTKGLKRATEWKITISANALELDHEKLAMFMPGTKEVVTETVVPEDPGHTKFRPNANLTDTDYINNLAYITRTQSGMLVAYVIENVLGDGNFSAAFADKDEIVPEVTFTAHFDPANPDVVPTYIAQFDQPASV